MKCHTSEPADSGLKPARSETGGRDAGSQLLFDFGALSAPDATVISPGRECPEWRFADAVVLDGMIRAGTPVIQAFLAILTGAPDG